MNACVLLDPPLADLLAVDEQRHGAPLAEAAAVVGELGAHLVLARGQPDRSTRWCSARARRSCNRTSACPPSRRGTSRRSGRPGRGSRPRRRPPARPSPRSPRTTCSSRWARCSRTGGSSPRPAAATLRPRSSSGRPAISALNRSAARSSSGSTLYFAASISQRRCSSASLLGLLRGEVLALAPVLGGVVELPVVLVERDRRGRPRRPTACGAWSPPSSPRGRCRGCRTSRSTGSCGVRARSASSNE